MTGGALIMLMQKPNTKSRSLRALFIGNAVFQVITAFRGWMVVIDDQNYMHGPLYPVYMVFYSAVIIIITIRMLSYGRSFQKQNRKSLYATILLVFVGIGMQEVLGAAAGSPIWRRLSAPSSCLSTIPNFLSSSRTRRSPNSRSGSRTIH